MSWEGRTPSIQDIREDAQGRIWALTNSESLFRIDDQTLGIPVWDLPHEQIVITRLRSSPDGTIWLSTSSGFHVLNDGKITQYPYFKDYTVLDFCLDSENSGYMVDRSGSIFRFDGDKVIKKSDLPPAAARSVYDMTVTHSGSLWIATFKGLFLFSRNSLHNFEYRNGLASNVIHSIFIDREGCLWYASDNGLGKIPGLMFRRLMPTTELPISSVFGICEDTQDRIWIAANDGLIRLGEKQNRIWRNEDGLIGDSVYAVAALKNGVALTTPHGLFRVDTQDKIHHLVEDDETQYLNLIPHGDSIWLISDDGLFRYSEKSGIVDFTAKIDLKNQSPVTTVYFDSQSNLWIASDGDGLFFLPEGDFERIQRISDLPSMRVFSIVEDFNGTMWIGTLAGLCNIKDFKVQSVFGIKQGLQSEDIWTVLTDMDSNVWVGTSRGLSSIQDGRIQNYDYEDGLSGEDFVSNCRYVDSKGRLWFGGMGITIVDPAEKMPVVKPLTSLRFSVWNDANFRNEEIIPAGRNTFEFGFMCSSFRNELQNNFRYQLLGYDSFRSDPSRSSEVRYTNLPKGHYIFVVESSNRDGQWSETAASISFEVLPAWYQRKLVGAIFVCVLLLLIRVIIRWRNFRLARLNIWLRNEVKRQTNVIQQQLYRLEEQKNLMENLAITDELTNLHNRRYFYKKLQDAWITSKVEKTPVSIIILDLDHFKEVNDLYGHLAGDTVLQTVSGGIVDKVPPGGTVARFGGEEFIILLEDTILDQAICIADEVREAVGQKVILCGDSSSLRITLSGGVASCIASKAIRSPDQLVKAADDALYQAKNGGRNRIVGTASATWPEPSD